METERDSERVKGLRKSARLDDDDDDDLFTVTKHN